MLIVLICPCARAAASHSSGRKVGQKQVIYTYIYIHIMYLDSLSTMNSAKVASQKHMIKLASPEKRTNVGQRQVKKNW